MSLLKRLEHGGDHPRVAIRLNNLAQLLWDTDRLPEAEPLLRRCVAIFSKFAQSTGHEHPHMQAVTDNYRQLLAALGLSAAEIHAKLQEVLGGLA